MSDRPLLIWRGNAGRRLRDTQLNSVETHLAVGDVLAYDVSLGIASADHTDQEQQAHIPTPQQLPYLKQQAATMQLVS